MKIEVTVSALVHLTESAEKVKEAIKKLFPDVELKLEQRPGFEDRLVGSATGSSGLKKLHELLRKQKILDTARTIFLKSREGSAIELRLNKQIAYVGKINFAEDEIALGPIYVTVEAEDLDRLIDWLAPVTEDGRPVEEIEI